MSAHIHTYTYIHTRIQNVHMNARKARLKQRCGSDCAGAQLDAKKLCPSPCPLQSRGGYPSWPAARQLPVHEERRISAEQPQPTAAHRTITTARRRDYIRLSALVRSRSTQFIVHASSQLGRDPPKQGHFSAILVGFLAYVICVSVCPNLICVIVCLMSRRVTVREQIGHKRLMGCLKVPDNVYNRRGS